MNVWIRRDENGKVRFLATVHQEDNPIIREAFKDCEVLADAHPDVLAFLNPPAPPQRDLYAEIDALKAQVAKLEKP
jgi:hypothetical protein